MDKGFRELSIDECTQVSGGDGGGIVVSGGRSADEGTGFFGGGTMSTSEGGTGYMGGGTEKDGGGAMGSGT